MTSVVPTAGETRASPRRHGPARIRALAKALVVVAVVVGLDQLTKHTIGTSIRPDQTKSVIPGLHFVYVRNTGVAFGVLGGSGGLVYALVGIALVALVAYLLRRPARRGLWVPVGMLVGGAAGNLIDRIVHGSVIDFIKLPDWPAFNVADMSITFGVIVLVLVIEYGGERAAA